MPRCNRSGMLERPTARDHRRDEALKPDNVTDIVLTHLDNDYGGGLHDFPRALVRLLPEELDSYDGTRPRGPYKPYQVSRATRFATHAGSGERWFGVDTRSVPLPGDLDLKLVPGHTLGHCGVAYREDGRWSLHAGDAYFDGRVYFLDQPPALPIEIAFQSSPDARVASLAALRRIRAQHADEVAMFCTHDQAEFMR